MGCAFWRLIISRFILLGDFSVFSTETRSTHSNNLKPWPSDKNKNGRNKGPTANRSPGIDPPVGGDFASTVLANHSINRLELLSM